MKKVDLKQEQEFSLSRPTYKYSLAAKFFFASMDMVTGRKVTLPKVLLIELLACIPYRAWELRMYGLLTLKHSNRELVKKRLEIIEWSREAQDNEYWHVRAVQEKMLEDNVKRPWYLSKLVVLGAIASYILFTRTIALLSLKRAFLFNAEFEDHAEHVYAHFVKDHPEWETQPVTQKPVLDRMPFDSWADVFRRIGLDEREHRDASFVEAGMPEEVVGYASDTLL